MVVRAANGVFVYFAALALYVFDSRVRPDTPADRFGKLFGLFWMWTFVIVPVFAVLVGWRAARDVERHSLGRLKDLWRPTIEGVAFGLAVGFVVFLATVAGAGDDLVRPGEWRDYVTPVIQVWAALAVLSGIGAGLLALINRMVWRLAKNHEE
jgi:hypothetical protein